MRIGIIFAALAVATLAGCGTAESMEGSKSEDDSTSSPRSSIAAKPPADTVTIMVQIAPARTKISPEGDCQGDVFFNGLRKNGYVSVADAAGVTVGASTYQSATLQPDGSCRLLAPTDVVRGSAFYSVNLGVGDPVIRPADEAHSEGIGVGYGY
ncbi:hypothetical protein ACJEDT_20095 [Rhodococcoides fascians]|jgi:hypothetical protein|uniref:hypothetical protein n=1 Tax=Nocardiaceae TaxID=85025 RepID=UPI001C91A7A4|nr:hypothetical protein [Rhodococcus fascians]